MTYYDTSHWTITDEKCGLLLFAQSFEELLATHSHDSYKVPALNFHYICLETQNVIDLIEDDVLDRGNLIPLFSEMKFLFYKDPVAQKLFGNNFDAVFARKNTKGTYDKKPIKVESGKDVDDILPVLKKGVKYMIAEMGRNNQYYVQLILEIKEQISHCEYDLLKLDSLYNLARGTASELINQGFSQAYIYDCMKQTFFDNSQEVTSTEIIDGFFKCFRSASRKFCLYFPLNSIKQKIALEDYRAFEVSENIYEMFDLSIPYILKYNCEASDPYSAREEAIEIANFCLSVNQFVKHNKYEYNPKYAEVVDIETKKATFIKKPEAPIVRGYTNCEEIEVKDLLNTCFGLRTGVFQVLQLHSAALISKNTDNQLINLWTAIEVAVPVVRKDGLSRINQICNVLTAALSRNYFCVLAHQLLIDIELVSVDAITKIEKIDYGNDTDSKLLAMLTLQKYSDAYDEVSSLMLKSAPLLACRMHRYKSQWSNTTSIKKAYIAHEERLSQQIMRIYRTRNMLVHDGTSLPYMEYVLQNLHYYIDSFVGFLNSYYKLGYLSVQTIVDAMQFQEQLYLEALSANMQIDENSLNKFILRKASIV